MSRIRSVHPGIWTDEAFMSVSAHARLLLIGLWTEAYDDGVFEWKPLTLKARIFPVDAVDVVELLIELVNAGIIARLERSAKQPGAIRNFQKYQRPKKPNSSGMLPDEWLDFVGARATDPASDDDNPEPVRNQLPTSTEKSPQMEDGGGRMEDKPLAQHPTASRGRADLDLLENRLREASGTERSPSPGLFVMAPILGLLDAGHDLEADILPTIRALSQRAKRKPSTWGYYTEAIKEASAKRRGLANGGLSPPIASKDENIFERAARSLSNGPIRDGGRNAATIDALPRLSDQRGFEQRDDLESLSDSDRGMHASRAY